MVFQPGVIVDCNSLLHSSKFTFVFFGGILLCGDLRRRRGGGLRRRAATANVLSPSLAAVVRHPPQSPARRETNKATARACHAHLLLLPTYAARHAVVVICALPCSPLRPLQPLAYFEATPPPVPAPPASIKKQPRLSRSRFSPSTMEGSEFSKLSAHVSSPL